MVAVRFPSAAMRTFWPASPPASRRTFRRRAARTIRRAARRRAPPAGRHDLRSRPAPCSSNQSMPERHRASTRRAAVDPAFGLDAPPLPSTDTRAGSVDSGKVQMAGQRPALRTHDEVAHPELRQVFERRRLRARVTPPGRARRPVEHDGLRRTALYFARAVREARLSWKAVPASMRRRRAFVRLTRARRRRCRHASSTRRSSGQVTCARF